MVVPGADALDTTVCVLGTLRCALDVGGGGKGCVCACLPFCHASFLGGFHWVSEGFAPWLRRVGRVADGSAVLVCVFGLGFWRGLVGRCLVDLIEGLECSVLRSEIGGILGSHWVQIANFGGVGADSVDVLVGIV